MDQVKVSCANIARIIFFFRYTIDYTEKTKRKEMLISLRKQKKKKTRLNYYIPEYIRKKKIIRTGKMLKRAES